MRNTIINALILMGFCLAGLDLTGHATNAPTGRATLNLRLVTFVPEAGSSVDTMKEKVMTIFARCGIQVSWLECVRNGEATGHFKCDAPRPVNEICVRIVPGEAGDEDALDPDGLGFAAPAGSLVTLFYRAAERLSGPGRTNIGHVLGCAAAHELGHILLGEGAHTGRGLMESHWTKKTAMEILRGRLTFSDQQAGALRQPD